MASLLNISRVYPFGNQSIDGLHLFLVGVADKTYATASGGYLTLKASTQSIKLNVDEGGAVTGYTEESAA